MREEKRTVYVGDDGLDYCSPEEAKDADVVHGIRTKLEGLGLYWYDIGSEEVANALADQNLMIVEIPT